MRKRLVGLVLAGAVFVGGPLSGTASANGEVTDPVLCFVAAQAILGEAQHEYAEGHLSIAELRAVLVGTASFLGDCLTPSESTEPPLPSVPSVPSVPVPNVDIPPIHFPSFPTLP